MSEQSAVSGTGGTNSEGDLTVRYSVPQMARYLGISERAVRKQIEGGKLFAVKEDRAWVVIVDQSAVPGSTRSGTNPKPEPTPAGMTAALLAVPDSNPATADTASTAGDRAANTVPPEPGTARPVVDDNIAPHDQILTVEHAEPRGTDQDRGAVPDQESAVQSGTNTAQIPPVDLSPLVNLVAELTRKNAELTEAATVWQFRARHLEEQIRQLSAGDSAESERPENEASGARPATFAATPAPDTSVSSQGSETRSWWRRMFGLH